MSESAERQGAATAGSLLRRARLAQGLHIGALAAGIKVTPRKLELLESDNYAELPDATFTRALAQAVCRALKIDPLPVLALLPPPNGHRLERVAEGLKTTFHGDSGRSASSGLSQLARPAVWGPIVLLLAAAIVYLLPAGVWNGLQAPAGAASSTISISLPDQAASAAAPDSSAPATSASGPAAASSPVGLASPVAPGEAVAVSAADMLPVAAAPRVLQVRTIAGSWVEVLDARGQSLISRVVPVGETLGLEGVLPMKVKIGNASATQLVFRGQPFDLLPHTRDNVARFELR